MSAPVVPPAAAAPAAPPAPSAPAPVASAGSLTTDSPTETPRVRSVARRWLFWIVVVVAAIGFAIFSVLLTASGTPDGERYSLQNAGPSGSMAVAEVLRQQGVDVVAASSLDDARAAVSASDGDATVLVYDAYGYLDGDRLDEVAALGEHLVLLEPGSTELDALAPDISGAGAPEQVDEVAADCALPAAQRAERISQPTATYRITGSGVDAVTCFPSYDDAFAVIEVPADSGTGTGTVTVFGAGDALLNESVIEYGNAALALGVLGENPTLVWYLPGPDDVEAGDTPATLGELTPGWVTPVMLLLILTVVAAGIWRGRRFGPVVVENLPVTVRASETMEGRARLYAKQASFGRALDALRIGTIARLTVQLALPRHATVVEVSRAVAAVTGRHVDEVHHALVGAVPRSEAELLALSDQLLVIEQEVGRATRDL